jgi:hypothetical protein
MSAAPLRNRAAAAWLLLFIAGVSAAAVILAWRLPITGTVSATVVVRQILRPFAIALAAVVLLGTYVAMKTLFGDKRTSSALGRLLGVFKDAGAAEELRNRDRNRQNDDN